MRAGHALALGWGLETVVGGDLIDVPMIDGARAVLEGWSQLGVWV